MNKKTLSLDLASKLDLTDKKLFKKYADIKQKIRALQDEAMEIEMQVVMEMDANKLDKVETNFGSFYFTIRKAWEYPAYVEEAKEAYNSAKKKAELTGEAKAKQGRSLAFRSSK